MPHLDPASPALSVTSAHYNILRTYLMKLQYLSVDNVHITLILPCVLLVFVAE